MSKVPLRAAPGSCPRSRAPSAAPRPRCRGCWGGTICKGEREGGICDSAEFYAEKGTVREITCSLVFNEDH